MAYYKIRPKSGTASQWTTANTVLGEREIGFEYPSGGIGTGLVKMKMGDGITPWNSLPYATISPEVENAESTSTDKVPSSAYVKGKFDILDNMFSTAAEILSDISWSSLLNKEPGVYVINQGAVGSPNDQYYGSLVLFKLTTARIIAIATFDDLSVYAFAGTTGSRSWKKLST